MAIVAEKYPKRFAPYAEQCYVMFIQILRMSPYTVDKALEADGKVDIDEHISYQQIDVLTFISDYVHDCPEAYASHFEELFDVIIKFTPVLRQVCF